MNEHEKWMERACMLAKRGLGRVDPNPMVGAVIVKDGEMIAEGWHKQYGQLHAERDALKNAKEAGRLIDLENAVMYATLEPCCHYGKTPPCTEAIIESGIKTVVVGCLDPNPLIAGKGIKQLKEHGIKVILGVMENHCKNLNERFFHYIKTGMPYLTMKYAMTADGKIATVTGDSKWVTGEKARAHVHFLRHQYKGIMVGINTVLQDDPMLNCRLNPEHLADLFPEEDKSLLDFRKDDLESKGPNHPIRIVCDSRLRIPTDSQLVQTALEIPLIVGCCEEAMNQLEKVQLLEDAGVKIIPVKESENGHLDLKALMKELGQMKISSILLEGGGELNFSALEGNLVNEVLCYIAPKLIGGRSSSTPVSGPGITEMNKAVVLENTGVRSFEPFGDILLEYRVRHQCGEEEEDLENRNKGGTGNKCLQE